MIIISMFIVNLIVGIILYIVIIGNAIDCGNIKLVILLYLFHQAMLIIGNIVVENV